MNFTKGQQFSGSQCNVFNKFVLNQRYHLLTFVKSKFGKNEAAVSIKDNESGVKTYLTVQEIPYFVEQTMKLKNVRLKNLHDYELTLLDVDQTNSMNPIYKFVGIRKDVDQFTLLIGLGKIENGKMIPGYNVEMPAELIDRLVSVLTDKIEPLLKQQKY